MILQLTSKKSLRHAAKAIKVVHRKRNQNVLVKLCPTVVLKMTFPLLEKRRSYSVCGTYYDAQSRRWQFGID